MRFRRSKEPDPDLPESSFDRDGKDDAGNDKPADSLIIHVYDDHVDVSVGGHYINHQGVWTSGGPLGFARKRLPAKRYSQFVVIELPELRLERKPLSSDVNKPVS